MLTLYQIYVIITLYAKNYYINVYKYKLILIYKPIPNAPYEKEEKLMAAQAVPTTQMAQTSQASWTSQVSQATVSTANVKEDNYGNNK